MTWPTVSLGEIFDIARGGSPRPIDAYITEEPDGINWVMIGDASNSGKYIESTKKRIIKGGASRSRMVYPGDFLLTNSMSFGRPYIMRTSGCIHDGWLVLKKRTEDVDEEFFYYLLGSDFVYQQFAKKAAGATVKNLNIDLVRQVEVVFPPLAEQKRIAAILDQAESLRAKRRAALGRLDELAQAIFVEMFGDTRSNPKGWPQVRLQQLIRAGDSICYGVLQPGDDVADGVPLVRVGDLQDGVVQQRNLKRIAKEIDAGYSRSRLHGDEVLLSCVGSVGLVALADESNRGFNIARAVARIPLQDGVSRVYVAEFLKSPSIQSYFKGELRTVAQPTLNIKQISELEVFLPPFELQDVFVQRLQQIELQKSICTRHLAELDALFASLQHRAFRGEL